MGFSHLLLRNWRNFTSVEVTLPDRVFLIGPNASGKSNFLDVFRFMRDLAVPGRGLQEALRLRGGVGRVRSLAARAMSDVIIDARVELDDGSWRYCLTFNHDSKMVAAAQRSPGLRSCFRALEQLARSHPGVREQYLVDTYTR
jgi:predicted ATPase